MVSNLRKVNAPTILDFFSKRFAIPVSETTLICLFSCRYDRQYNDILLALDKSGNLSNAIVSGNLKFLLELKVGDEEILEDDDNLGFYIVFQNTTKTYFSILKTFTDLESSILLTTEISTASFDLDNLLSLYPSAMEVVH